MADNSFVYSAFYTREVGPLRIVYCPDTGQHTVTKGPKAAYHVTSRTNESACVDV